MTPALWSRVVNHPGLPAMFPCLALKVSYSGKHLRFWQRGWLATLDQDFVVVVVVFQCCHYLQFGLNNALLWESSLCVIEWLIASLVSIHLLPVGLLPFVTNKNVSWSCQMSSWRVKSSLFESHCPRYKWLCNLKPLLREIFSNFNVHKNHLRFG